MNHKGVVLALLPLLVASACNNASRSPVFSEAEVREIMNPDGPLSKPHDEAEDSFALAPEPVPAAIDELFDDFISVFDQNAELQRSRVRYPFIIVDETGTDTVRSAAEWKHHFVFMQQDFSTVLWTSARETLLSDNINVNHAEVQQIYLHSRRMATLIFDRDSASGRWELTSERHFGFAATPLASFLDFYARFATDTLYQRNHISDPLRFVSTDEDEDDPLVGFIDVDQWFEFAPELPRDVLTNIRYGQRYDHPRRIIMQMRGINNGMEAQLSFMREGGQWKLIGYEN